MPPSSASSNATTRKDFASWFNVADTFNNLAIRVLPEVKPSQSNNQQMLSAILFARTLTSFQAAIVLAERGMLADARTVVRAAAETTIILCALVKDASVCDLLIDRHFWHHRKLRNAYLNDSQAMAEMSAQEINEIKAVIAEIENGRPNIKDMKQDPISIATLAEKAEVNALYNTVYRFTSGDAAHTSLDALSRHIHTDANNDIVGLIFKTNETDLPNTLHSAMSVLGFALNSASQFFQLTQFDKDLGQCIAAWKALGEPSDYEKVEILNG
jgi:hypothetical protein